jgi:hypothetical protein
VEIVLILVAGASLSAAWVWWRMSRPSGVGKPRAGRTTQLIGFGGSSGEEAGEIFAFAPAAAPALDDDRPRSAVSVARLALAIAVSAAVLVVAAWTIGVLIKLQLDRYFIAGS